MDDESQMAAGCVLSLWRVSLPLTSLIHFNYHNDNCLLLWCAQFLCKHENRENRRRIGGNVYLIFDRLSGTSGMRRGRTGEEKQLREPLMYLSDPNWIASLLIRLRLAMLCHSNSDSDSDTAKMRGALRVVFIFSSVFGFGFWSPVSCCCYANQV